MTFKTNMLLLGSSIALACAACSAAPKAEVASQAQPGHPPAPAIANAGQAPRAMSTDALPAQPKISRAAATQTALAQVSNGVVRDAELEKEHQRLVWSFDIATPDSQDITEIQVDAMTGKIASTQVETPSDQAQETAADKASH